MKSIRHTADTLFTVLLLLIFALFALTLAGTGAAIYQNTIAHLDENYTSRTAVSYVTEKIRQHDQYNAVTLTELEELPALCLTETINDQLFFTYIYFYDGALQELFIKEGVTAHASNGTPIVSLASFSIECISDSEDRLLQITACSETGTTLTSLVHPSCS